MSLEVEYVEIVSGGKMSKSGCLTYILPLCKVYKNPCFRDSTFREHLVVHNKCKSNNLIKPMETNKEKCKHCNFSGDYNHKDCPTCCFCGEFDQRKQFEPQDKEVLKQELIGLVRENVKIIEKYTNHIEPQVDKQLSQCNDCFDGDCCNGKVDGCTYHCCVKDKQQDIREELDNRLNSLFNQAGSVLLQFIRNEITQGQRNLKLKELDKQGVKYMQAAISQAIEQERERLTKNHFCCKYNTFKQSDFCDNCLNLTINNHDNN